MRREAVECLAAFGPRARIAVPPLRELHRSDDRVLRCLAALALSGIEGWGEDRVRATLSPLFDDLALPSDLRTVIDSMTESNLDFSRSPDRAQILRKSLEHVLRLSQARAVRLSQHA